VMLALKGFAGHIHFEAVNPLIELLNAFLEAGNKLYVCSPCMTKRKLKAEDLIAGAEVVGAAKVTEEVLASVNVLTY
jgi:uncharacterized protein